MPCIAYWNLNGSANTVLIIYSSIYYIPPPPPPSHDYNLARETKHVYKMINTYIKSGPIKTKKTYRLGGLSWRSTVVRTMLSKPAAWDRDASAEN